MIHQMKLQPKYFDYIKYGTKRIEISLYDEKRQKIKLDDTIEFTKEPINQEKIKTKVIALLRYRNFEEMFEDFDISLLGDNSITKKELIQELEQYYSKDLQSKYSVIGIKVQVIK